jgi:hypothetical protein
LQPIPAHIVIGAREHVWRTRARPDTSETHPADS